MWPGPGQHAGLRARCCVQCRVCVCVQASPVIHTPAADGLLCVHGPQLQAPRNTDQYGNAGTYAYAY
jgi:hypothetical protein